MNANDLLSMLDLDGREEPSKADSLTITATTDRTTPKGPTSATALKLDRWGLRRGADVLAANANIRGSLKNKATAEHAAADFFGVAFEPEPELNPACTDPIRGEFIRQLLETPECRALRSSTVLDNAASELAAESFAESYGMLADGKAEKGTAEDIRVLKAVGAAISEAADEVEASKETGRALGMGGGKSTPGTMDAHAIASFYRRIRNNPKVKEIIDMTGRYRRVAQSKQRQKTTHGYDDVSGVTLDADLGRLLPQEMAMLADPDLEDDVLRRFVERQTMCREHTAVEPIGKGPIIVCVDESGSMCGKKIKQAKAIALTMAWVARSQRRWCGLVAYSGDTGERLLPLPPGRWDEDALIKWLEAFIDGGSDLDVPVREMPDYWKRFGPPREQTDVIFITDAICHIPQDIQQAFTKWKTSVKARLTTLVIRSEAGDLAAISDECHLVPSLDVNEGGVDKILSI